MIEWWDSLGGAALFFWTVAILASVFQILLFLGSLIGSGEFDHHIETPGATDSMIGGAEGAVKVLSVRAVAAFAVGFGWAGVLFLGEGRPLTATVAIAIFTGVVYMMMIWAVMRFMLSLRADGTLDFRNAIGKSGKVYVTVPASRKGDGQVEILVQGRLITATAVTDSPAPLAPQAPVKVIAVENNTLIVSPCIPSS